LINDNRMSDALLSLPAMAGEEFCFCHRKPLTMHERAVEAAVSAVALICARLLAKMASAAIARQTS
jgi:hypothetical protein